MAIQNSPQSANNSLGAKTSDGVDLHAVSMSSANVLNQKSSLPNILQVGEVYRLTRTTCIGAYVHMSEYDQGRFIHVKIISGPSKNGVYQCTTYGDDGQHLGPGGGWGVDQERQHCHFRRDQLEPLAPG